MTVYLAHTTDTPRPPRPRVLTEQYISNLRALNSVTRRLRGWGITVLAYDLHGDFGCPQVAIKRDPQHSIAPLLDAAGPRGYTAPPDGGLTTVTCMLGAVLVTWQEPAA